MSVFEERLADMIAAIVNLNSQKRELDQLRDRVKTAELSVRKSPSKFRRERTANGHRAVGAARKHGLWYGILDLCRKLQDCSQTRENRIRSLPNCSAPKNIAASNFDRVHMWKTPGSRRNYPNL
jgi:hypothetical protein